MVVRVQGELEEDARAVEAGVVELARVVRAVGQQGGVGREPADCQRGEVGVVAAGVAGDADVGAAVRHLGVADLQRPAGEGPPPARRSEPRSDAAGARSRRWRGWGRPRRGRRTIPAAPPAPSPREPERPLSERERIGTTSNRVQQPIV